MPNHCFAPGCNTNYPSARKRNKLLGKKNPTVFAAPKDAELLEKWRRAIPRKDRIFKTTDKICELHFDDECIVRNFETKLPDGSVSVLERERPHLKEGSVPSKFPNLPKYLSNIKKRKVPVDLTSLSTEEKKIHTEVADETSDQEHVLQYVNLIKELENVEKPDPWWTISYTLDYVICAKWDTDCACERRIVIFKDFSSKIFLRNKQISIEETCIQNIESLSQLLQKVHRLTICKDLGSEKMVNCIGYVHEDNLSRNKFVQCSVCRSYKKKEHGAQSSKRIMHLANNKFNIVLQKKNAIKRNSPSLKQVIERKTMDFPSSLDLREALQHFKYPVIFKNSLKSWQHIPWTMEQLSAQCGNILLDFRIASKSNNSISWEGSSEYVQATIDQFIEWQKNKDPIIQHSSPFNEYKAQDFWAYSSYNYMSDAFSKDESILKAVNWTAFGYPETSGKDSAFWIGNEGAYTPCHFDTYGFNLVAQIQGRKKWTLFPPEDTPSMYPTRIPYEESSVFSSVNILNPNFKVHPLFKLSHPHVVTLEPGDVLFVPSKWWHFVQSLDTTVSINTWITFEKNDSHLEEGVTRALMSSFISYFEPVGESWVNPNEELVSPEETLEYILLELTRIKSSNIKQKSLEERNSVTSTMKKCKKLLESDVHSSNTVEDQIRTVLNHKDIKYVTSEEFLKWYKRPIDEYLLDSSQNVNVKNIIDCFVHPEVISVICKLLKNI